MFLFEKCKGVVSLVIFVALLCMTIGCTSTKPMLSFTGSNYHSVTDDMAIEIASKESFDKISRQIPQGKKMAIVQVVDDANNDLIADRLYEMFYLRGEFVGKFKQDDLTPESTKAFDTYLIFYPVVYGVEHSDTKPTIFGILGAYIIPAGLGALFGAAAESSIPFYLGGAGSLFISPLILSSMTYEDRISVVTLHVRMVDAKTGDVLWTKNFSGHHALRLKGGLEGIVTGRQ